jgi:hypothetical protein
MLVICNGAIKSGSTWLYNILRSLRPFEAPREEYLTLKNPRHPCIRPDRLSDFLSRENYVEIDYLSKNHLDRPEHKELLSNREHVYVFDIERDPKDVVVSHYYHERFRNGYQASFADFYWSTGRETISSLSRYHALWRDAGPRSYVSSYEELHRDFAAEAQRIAAVLGVALTEDQVRALREKTSLGNLRKEYEAEPRFEGEKFFRKGTVGDWENHFDSKMLEDLERIERHGIGRFDLPSMRQRLSSMWQKR